MSSLRTQDFIAGYWEEILFILSLESLPPLVITLNLLHSLVWWKLPLSPGAFTCRGLINHFCGEKKDGQQIEKEWNRSCQALRHSAVSIWMTDYLFAASVLRHFFFCAFEGSAAPVKTFAWTEMPHRCGITSALLPRRTHVCPMVTRSKWLLDSTAFENLF